jgi:hypothetical protein
MQRTASTVASWILDRTNPSAVPLEFEDVVRPVNGYDGRSIHGVDHVAAAVRRGKLATGVGSKAPPKLSQVTVPSDHAPVLRSTSVGR